jgi:hypothetical protein
MTRLLAERGREGGLIPVRCKGLLAERGREGGLIPVRCKGLFSFLKFSDRLWVFLASCSKDTMKYILESKAAGA